MDRQAQLVRLMLAILGAFLAVVGWARWAGGQAAVWHDPSPHRVQFVTVDEGVRLEVLDWGTTGRPIVLLAGSGNSAHVFDEFAPKLADDHHVYGITRRGYGASTQPASGYDDQRLADDVLAVLVALKIAAPVLAGHSMAGGELTTLGNQHSDRLAGLVYLDALGDPGDFPAGSPAYMDLFRTLPAPMREPPPPDMTSFSAYRESQRRNKQGVFPESELRQLFAANADGAVGRYKASTGEIHNAIGEGQKKRVYTSIRVPVLALFEFPRPKESPDYQPKNAEERAAIEAFGDATKVFTDRWVKSLKDGVPRARVVDVPGAGHFVFLTREADVLREMRAFIAAL